MSKKLKVIGPYTPEHAGPFCNGKGIPVEVRMRDGRGDYPLAGYVGDSVYLMQWDSAGRVFPGDVSKNWCNLMNAREVLPGEED